MIERVVVLQDVTKKIGGRTVIESMDLEICKGEIFGLLGPNGAGKTMTIRLMVGLIAPTFGDVFIHGHSVSRQFEAAIARVGTVFESPKFYDFLTGHENLLQYANMYPAVSRERIDEVINLNGLMDYIDDPVRTYSLGMRERLGIAQALLHKPSILILDEPTNGLDPEGIKGLRDHLRNLARLDGTTVVISSHLLSEMELICDRVAFIKKGRLIKVKPMAGLGSDSVFLFDVDRPDAACAVIRQQFPDTKVAVTGQIIEVVAELERIAELNALLVRAEHKVYGIQPRHRALEEEFLEVTTNAAADSVKPQ